MTTQQPAFDTRKPKRGERGRWAEFIARYGVFFVLVGMVILLSVLTPIIRGEQYFLRVNNLLQVAQQASINAIIAVGMTFVIISGGIDLSVGSIVAIAGVVGALAMRDLAVGPILGFLFMLGAGAACGLFNGFFVTKLRLSPFIVTLGTMGIFRGLALVFGEGRSIYGFDRSFVEIFDARIGDVPIAVVVALIVAILGWLLLRFTRFGKYAIAIGGNEQTARRAGINIERYKLGIYTLAGLLSGVAAVLLVSRLRSGDPTFGQLFELDAIAAAVMGGTSLSGGSGSIAGTIIGALIIALVKNALNLYNVPGYYQDLVIGAVIVMAVALDQWRKQQGQRD